MQEEIYSDDFKSLVLEASLSNTVPETSKQFNVPEDVISKWQKQEGFDSVLATPTSPSSKPSTSTPSSAPPPPTPNRKYSQKIVDEVLNFLQDHTVAEASRQYNIPHSTVFGWNKKAAAVGLSISQGPSSVVNKTNSDLGAKKFQVLQYSMNHSPGEVKRKFGIPHSMLYKWQREQIRMVPTGIFADKVKVTHYPYLNKLVSILPKPADCNSTTTTKTSPSRSSVCSPSIARSPSSHDNVKYQEKVVKYAKAYGNDEACKKFDVRKDELQVWVRKLGSRVHLDYTWETRDRILAFAQKHKNYKYAAKKFGVSVAMIRGWAEDRKNNVNDVGDGDDVNHDDEEDEEDDDDDEDVSPIKKVRTRAYVTDAEHEVTKGRRVKEYADEIKEAAVRYGYKYGWTAAAIKYGTSSTSVSRWATYDDPKSPWKLKVLAMARRVGVKEAARKFKVSQPTLEAWLEDSQENSHRTKMMKKVKKDEATDGEYYEDDSKDVKNTVSNTNMETLADDEHALKEDTEQKETVMNLFTVLSEKCEVCDKTLLKHETMMEHLVINHLDSNGNCDVCGVLTDDFEKHFQLHLVKVEDKLEVKVEVNVEEKVAVDEAKEFNDNDSGFENDLKQADEISDADVNDLLKDLLVDV